MKPSSPWAEVQPEETLPTLVPPASASSVWAEPQGVDLHAGLKPIAAPAPQPIPAMGKVPAEMEAPKEGKKYEYPTGTDSVDLPQAKMPNLSAPVAQPAQKAEAPQTIKSHLNSRLERDYEKDANPWGSPDNHPGFLGKLAHTLNHATGGDTRRQWEENGLVHQINTQQAAEDQSAHLGAETAKTAQETENLAHPANKYTTIESDQGTMRFDPKTGTAEPLQVGGTQLQSPGKKAAPMLHETDQGLFIVDPETKEVTPLTYNGQPLMPKPSAAKNTKEQLQAALVDAQNKGDVAGATKLTKQLKDIDPLAQSRLQVTIQGQQNVNNRAESNISRQDVRAHDKAYVQPAESVEKSYNMMDHAYNEYKAAQAKGQDLPTGAQSMLALSTHLATTFGNVKGARITKDMIAEHLGARSIGDDALVAVQKLTNGDRLSPAQWDAFHDLIKQSRNLSWQTAVKEADRKHIPVDFLPPDLQNSSGSNQTGSAPPVGAKIRDYTNLGGK